MSTLLSNRPIRLPARKAPSIADLKPTFLTIWSAQVAQVERLMDNVQDVKQLRVAMLMLLNLKWQIQEMIIGSGEEWFSGMAEDLRIQNVMENDYSKLQRRLLTIS